MTPTFRVLHCVASSFANSDIAPRGNCQPPSNIPLADGQLVVESWATVNIVAAARMTRSWRGCLARGCNL